MRVAVYVRVSTKQVHQQTLEQQLERLRDHLREQSPILEESLIFRADGCSGGRLNRPGLDRLRDAIRERRLDLVVLTAPDRLARNYVHQVLLLEEFEMRRGRLAKLRAGVLLPWTRAPYGYCPHPDRPRDPGGLMLNPGEAAVVSEFFARYLEPGVSLLQVARQLRDHQIPSPTGKTFWGLATVRGILRNSVYTGQVYAGRTRYRPARLRRSATHPLGRPHDTAIAVPQEEWIPVATVPATVAQEEFDRVQSKLSKNRTFARRHNPVHPYLLRALVSCGHCRRASIGRTLAHSPYGYACSGKIKSSGRDYHPYPSRFAPAPQLDELVWRDVCEALAHPTELTQALERAHGGPCAGSPSYFAQKGRASLGACRT